MSGLASNLVGHKIGDWTVEKKISKDGGTGGCFSSGYLVRHIDGREAFLKAINIGYAIKTHGASVNRTALLKKIAAEFEHEKSLLETCELKRMDRVVHAIDTGEYDHASDPYYVPYLVFELCKEGDIRRHPKMLLPTLAWRLRVFHGTVVGLMQLHNSRIFHQDLKPSNVLIEKGDTSKIADLGRATTSAPSAMFSKPVHWGDSGYTPVEFLYDHAESDQDIGKRAADFYMLGGIFAFLLANVNIFSAVLLKLAPEYHPRRWRGGFKAALPALQKATFDAVEEIVSTVPSEIKNDVREILLWLCHPEPQKRGHPKTVGQNGGDRFSLERLVSHADRVAIKARTLA